MTYRFLSQILTIVKICVVFRLGFLLAVAFYRAEGVGDQFSLPVKGGFEISGVGKFNNFLSNKTDEMIKHEL